MKWLLIAAFFCCCFSASQASNGSVTVVVNLLLADDEPGFSRKTVSLSWQRSFQREDDSALAAEEIKHYRIRYRKVGRSEYQTVLLSSSSLTSFITIGGRIGEQYEFAIQTIDRDGLASDYTAAQLVSL